MVIKADLTGGTALQTISQDESPKVKVILLQDNRLETFHYGYHRSVKGMVRILTVQPEGRLKRFISTQPIVNGNNVESCQPKGNINITNNNKGLPKWSNSYGSRVSIVAVRSVLYDRSNVLWKRSDTAFNFLGIRSYCSVSNEVSQVKVLSKLRKIEEFSKSNPDKYIDNPVYKLVCDVELLQIAYNNIRSRPGNNTPAVYAGTLDGISLDFLQKLSYNLRNESFQFSPHKRIRIPKAGGGQRPLTIASLRDKIVQEAMRIVLEAVFEPNFRVTSHGFRPNKSCHSALKFIRDYFKPSTLFIQGDISKCFDSIPHHKLIRLIENKIKDRQFTKLIAKSLKTGYFVFRHYQHDIAGTLQGSIISPILANVYLDQLDQFVAELKQNFDTRTKPRRTKIFRNKQWLVKKAKAVGDAKQLYKAIREMKSVPPKDYQDETYKRLVYVRYADHWIIGVRGSIVDANNILDKVKAFCSNIGLTISDTKTKITNLNTDKALFLGVNIFRSKTEKEGIGLNMHLKRANKQLRFVAPLDRIKMKLKEAGFIKQGISHQKYVWISNSHRQILHLYNSVFRGFMNYYSFVHNRSELISLLYWILKVSCAKLLASKFSMRTTAAVYKKYGKYLTEVNTKFEGKQPASFLKTKFRSNTNDFKVVSNQNIIPTLFSKSKSISRLEGLTCANWGSDFKVEIHDVRAMKDLKSKVSYFDKLMIRSNRKQIPLCRPCYMEYHIVRNVSLKK